MTPYRFFTLCLMASSMKLALNMNYTSIIHTTENEWRVYRCMSLVYILIADREINARLKSERICWTLRRLKYSSVSKSMSLAILGAVSNQLWRICWSFIFQKHNFRVLKNSAGIAKYTASNPPMCVRGFFFMIQSTFSFAIEIQYRMILYKALQLHIYFRINSQFLSYFYHGRIFVNSFKNQRYWKVTMWWNYVTNNRKYVHVMTSS